MVYTAPGKELSWWRPTGRPPGPGFALLRPIFPKLKELERYFHSINSFGNDDASQPGAHLREGQDQPGKEAPAGA